jgi:hypothetical protein
MAIRPCCYANRKGLAGVLERAVGGEYSVPVAGTKGHAAGFLRTVVALELQPGQRVLWIGDLDKSGGDIECSIRRTPEDAVGPLHWRRLAMTEDLAEAYNIEPIWKTDGRTRLPRPAIEVESLGQATLVTLVRAELDQLLPQPLASVHKRERRERDELRVLLNGS